VAEHYSWPVLCFLSSSYKGVKLLINGQACEGVSGKEAC
jgi:hypothetical protein